MIKTANCVLKGKDRRKNIGVREKEEEPVWFTEELRNEIKERRRLNRKGTKAVNEEEKDKWK